MQSRQLRKGPGSGKCANAGAGTNHWDQPTNLTREQGNGLKFRAEAEWGEDGPELSLNIWRHSLWKKSEAYLVRPQRTRLRVDTGVEGPRVGGKKELYCLKISREVWGRCSQRGLDLVGIVQRNQRPDGSLSQLTLRVLWVLRQTGKSPVADLGGVWISFQRQCSFTLTWGVKKGDRRGVRALSVSVNFFYKCTVWEFLIRT